VLEKKIVPLPAPAGLLRRVGSGMSRTFGHKIVSQISSRDGLTTMHLEYDYFVDSLNVRWIHAAESFDRNAHTVYFTYTTPYLVYSLFEITDAAVTYDSATGTATQHIMLSFDARVDDPSRSPDDFISRIIPSFGDREVLGWAGCGGIQLRFFNPKFAPDSQDWGNGPEA